METSLALEKNLTSPSGSARPGFSQRRLPTLPLLGETLLREGDNLIKKISDYLTNLRQQVSKEESLSVCLLKRLTFNSD